MKIILLSDCYAPRVGGIESQVHDLAHELSQLGHTVQVVTATAKGKFRGVKCQWEKQVLVTRITEKIPGNLPIAPRSKNLIRAVLSEADVIHIHVGVISPFAFDAIKIAKQLGVPTIISWHCLVPSGIIYRRIAQVEEWSQWATLTAVSTCSAARVENVARTKNKVHIIGNFISPKWWEEEKNTTTKEKLKVLALQEEETPLRLVTAMRLAPRKKILALLLCLAPLRNKIQLEIFGDGILFIPAKILSQILKLEVRFHGKIPREELARHYLNADLYISPVKLEAFGIAALEAHATGLPVFALKSSGIADFITPGLDGELVKNLREMRAKICEIVNQREKLARYRTADLSEDNRHSKETVVHQWEQLYEQLLP